MAYYWNRTCQHKPIMMRHHVTAILNIQVADHLKYHMTDTFPLSDKQTADLHEVRDDTSLIIKLPYIKNADRTK